MLKLSQCYSLLNSVKCGHHLMKRFIHFPAKHSINGSAIVVSADGGTIVCWHPPKTIPYEESEPLPVKETGLKIADSPLNVQHIETLDLRYCQFGPTDDELEKMFYTPKYHFRPRPRLKYKNPYKWMNSKERDSL